jgi:hypothetical protein
MTWLYFIFVQSVLAFVGQTRTAGGPAGGPAMLVSASSEGIVRLWDLRTAGKGGAVGLYNSNPVYPWLESAWFHQPSSL